MKKLILLMIAGVMTISCGDNKKETKSDMQIGTQPEETTTAAPVETETTNASDDEMAELTISGNDQMQFDKHELRVKAGQKVKLTLKHTGEMSVDVMGHNWALMVKGADMAEIGQAAAEAKDNDYIPPTMEDQFIVHTKMIGGGETTSIEFTAPAKGSYDYMCTFPGHYALMKGKLIVE